MEETSKRAFKVINSRVIDPNIVFYGVRPKSAMNSAYSYYRSLTRFDKEVVLSLVEVKNNIPCSQVFTYNCKMIKINSPFEMESKDGTKVTVSMRSLIIPKKE